MDQCVLKGLTFISVAKFSNQQLGQTMGSNKHIKTVVIIIIIYTEIHY